MKQGWELKKLVDVCIVERGSSPRPIAKYQTNSTDGVNWIKIGDTKGVDKYIYSTKEKITKEGSEKSRYVKEGDFILSNSMSFGKPFIMQTDGYIHDGWFALRLHDFINTEYFYHLLSSPYVNEQFHRLASGSVVKNISGDLVKKVLLPIPSLPEQQRIVAILDEAFEAIAKAKANAEQNLKNAKELFESYLRSVFENKGDGWEEKMLKEIGIAQTGTTPKTSDQENYGNFIPFIKPADIDIKGNGEIRYDNDGLSQQGLGNGRQMQEGSILMVCIGATIGKVGYVDRDVSCNQQINALTVKKDFSPKFIYYVLSSKWFFGQVMHNAAQATLPIINKGKWEKLTVSFPKSKSEQDAIVNKFDALQNETKKLEAIYQKKIKNLEELKKSILQKAFNGEL